MASRIDWYLVELERRLGTLLSEEETYTVLAESEDHLRSKVSDLLERGMPAAQAERAATRSFGSPVAIAFGVLEQRRSLTRERIGVAVLLIAAAVTFWCLGFIVTYMDPDGSFFGVSAFVLVLAALLTRRVAVKPLLIMGGIAGLIMGGVMAANNVPLRGGWNYSPRSFVDNAIQSDAAERSLLAVGVTRLTSGLDYYTKLKQAGGNTAKVSGQPLKDDKGNLVVLPKPGYAISARQLGIKNNFPMRIGRYSAYYDYQFFADVPNSWGEPREVYPNVYAYPEPYYGNYNPSENSKPTLAQVTDRWLDVGPGIIAGTQNRVRLLDARLDRNKAARDAAWSFSPPVFFIGLALGLFSSVVMAMAQWLAIQAARGFRWLRAARPLFA